VFQYPRLDRRVENRGSRLENVSKACFSIHDWIEGSKTMGNQIMPGQVKGFSIHDWIEGSKT